MALERNSGWILAGAQSRFWLFDTPLFDFLNLRGDDYSDLAMKLWSHLIQRIKLGWRRFRGFELRLAFQAVGFASKMISVSLGI